MNGRAWLGLGFGERLLKKNKCEWSAIDFFFFFSFEKIINQCGERETTRQIYIYGG